jgi:MFS family permease
VTTTPTGAGRGLFGRLADQARQYRAVLGTGPFATMFASAVLASVASYVVGVMLTIHVYRESGSSGLAVGALLLVRFLPNLVVAPLCGGLADRFNRRAVILACDAGRALLCLVLLWQWPVGVLMALAFAVTSLAAIAKPARYALVPRLCEPDQLVAANALLLIAATVAELISGALATVLVASLGRGAFAVAAVLALLAGLASAAYMSTGAPEGPSPPDPTPETGTGTLGQR